MAMSVVYSNFCGMVVSENRGGVISDYVHDTLGSTIGLMDSAGTMTDRWEYWPFGEVLSRTGTNATPLTFLGVLGYFQDVLSTLYYVRARHLRADLARWLTADPLWPEQVAYAYAANAPILAADPTGMALDLPSDAGSDFTPSLNNITKKLLSCCSFSSWYHRTRYYVLGVLVETVIVFKLCLCCCSDAWAALTLAVGGIAALLSLTGVLTDLGAFLGIISAVIGLYFAYCWLTETTERTCVGYEGVLTIGTVTTLTGSPYCCS